MCKSTRQQSLNRGAMLNFIRELGELDWREYLGGVERGQRNIALLNICRLADTLGLSAASLMELPNK